MQQSLPHHMAYMACSFSPYTQGLSGIPSTLPPGSMLILNDRMCFEGHSPDLVVGQLQEAVTQLCCESILLDFQRPQSLESKFLIEKILHFLPCPVGVSEGFVQDFDCPVFISPAPLHIPLAVHLAPWQGREIWLEAALGQTELYVTPEGISAVAQFPPEGLTGGFFEEALCCNYRTKVEADQIRFTLFDTWESLERKLDLAHSLGVSRAVGLWQELGTFQSGKQPACTSIAGKNHS